MSTESRQLGSQGPASFDRRELLKRSAAAGLGFVLAGCEVGVGHRRTRFKVPDVSNVFQPESPTQEVLPGLSPEESKMVINKITNASLGLYIHEIDGDSGFLSGVLVQGFTSPQYNDSGKPFTAILTAAHGFLDMRNGQRELSGSPFDPSTAFEYDQVTIYPRAKDKPKQNFSGKDVIMSFPSTDSDPIAGSGNDLASLWIPGVIGDPEFSQRALPVSTDTLQGVYEQQEAGQTLLFHLSSKTDSPSRGMHIIPTRMTASIEGDPGAFTTEDHLSGSTLECESVLGDSGSPVFSVHRGANGLEVKVMGALVAFNGIGGRCVWAGGGLTTLEAPDALNDIFKLHLLGPIA